jgi:stringent starvation protein B
MMTPIKPYLIRAVRDWAVDSGLTPLIVVDTTFGGVNVPADFIENGRVLLNVHTRAVQNFAIEDEWLLFATRFGGKRSALEIPVAAIRAIYARENGQGVTFPKESASQPGCAADETSSAEPEVDTEEPPKKPSHLRLVK